MPRKDERGTTDDPIHKGDDLTGGSDSSIAAADMDKGDPPDGPDKTAVLIEEEGGSAAGTRGPVNRPRVGRRPVPTARALEEERAEMAEDEPEPGVNEWGP